jgi:excisionase family DNA binding protein
MTMPDDAQPRENGIHDANGHGLPEWQWLTVGEVARALGLTEERVRQLIRERKIRATKIGGWMVRPTDLQAFIASRTNIPGDE